MELVNKVDLKMLLERAFTPYSDNEKENVEITYEGA